MNRFIQIEKTFWVAQNAENLELQRGTVGEFQGEEKGGTLSGTYQFYAQDDTYVNFPLSWILKNQDKFSSLN